MGMAAHQTWKTTRFAAAVGVGVLLAGPCMVLAWYSGLHQEGVKLLRVTKLLRSTPVPLTDARKAPTPYKEIFDRYGSCGTWQADYVRLHEKILAADGPRRILRVVGVQVGLTDRIVGAISGFYYALLTRRAFQISTYGELPGFDLVIDPANINWTFPSYTDDDPYMTAVRIEYNGVIYHSAAGRVWPDAIPEHERQRHGFMYHVNEVGGWDTANLTEQGYNADAEVMLYASNRGQLLQLFANPLYKDQLLAWGLTPETAWQCAFGFLFRPKPSVEELFNREVGVLSDQRSLRIGVNVRVGDPDELVINGAGVGQVFANRDYNLDRAKAYFDCAHEIEDTRKAANQSVVWYVISDSLGLRINARERWGDKILTNTEMQMIHPDCYHFEMCLGNDTAKELALKQGFGQLFTFAMTDIQVVTWASGFGRVGAIIGSWRNTIYQVESPSNLFGLDGLPRSCSVDAADPYYKVASAWAGL